MIRMLRWTSILVCCSAIACRYLCHHQRRPPPRMVYARLGHVPLNLSVALQLQIRSWPEITRSKFGGHFRRDPCQGLARSRSGCPDEGETPASQLGLDESPLVIFCHRNKLIRPEVATERPSIVRAVTRPTSARPDSLAVYLPKRRPRNAGRLGRW